MAESVCASPDEQYTEQERRNRDTVLAFYEAAVSRRDYESAFRHLDNRYVQHDPDSADGLEGLREFFERRYGRYPQFQVEIKRVFVEGNMVALHVRSLNGPTPNGEAAVDIFRLDSGKIIEHWNVIQPIPDSLPHANTMF